MNMQPLQMVMPGLDGTDEIVYWMPPDPVSNPRAMCVARDIIKHADRWENDRVRKQIRGIVPDGLEMIRRNYESNMALGRPAPWSALWGKEKGKVCILVSCGPSLPESLPEIRKLSRNRDKFFTIGLNRALTAHMLDYYMISDRRGDVDWTDPRADYGNTTLIASTCTTLVHPPRFKKRFWGDPLLDNTPDIGLPPISTDMCITLCDVMHAAYRMGASEIWLYGCDFALSGQMVDDTKHTGTKIAVLQKYYHDVTAAEGERVRAGLFRGKPPVRGINGRLVFTTWELMAYAAFTSTMARMIENSGGVPVVNKTPCGILFNTWSKAGGDHGKDVPAVVPVRAEEAQ